MNTWRGRGSVALALLAMLALPLAAPAQNGPNGPAAGLLGGLRPGQWIEIEGTAGAGGEPVSCTKIRHLTGDFLDDDWALRGTVTTVDARRREITVRGCRVRVGDRTVYNHPRPGFRAFTDLRPGLLIEVEGTFSAEGILLAAEVDDESDELAGRPSTREEVQVTGRIARVDARRRVITVMGIEFHVDDHTRLRSAIR